MGLQIGSELDPALPIASVRTYPDKVIAPSIYRRLSYSALHSPARISTPLCGTAIV